MDRTPQSSAEEEREPGTKEGVVSRKATVEAGGGEVVLQEPGKREGRKAYGLVVSFGFQRNPKKEGGQEKEWNEGPLPIIHLFSHSIIFNIYHVPVNALGT